METNTAPELNTPAQPDTVEPIASATYSPEDNKLRLYPFAHLSAEDYARVKAAGYTWAPRQGIFVAPMWTPAREDLARELAGEIEDEDKTLTERAEERADRFAGYSERRADEATAAKDSVQALADGIPLGQPILVGHHSERRARRDAEKIENGIRKAVKLWETSQYWQDRAAGAIRHARYKELPAVRARRIKGIEADRRKIERQVAECEAGLRFWEGEAKFRNRETGEAFQVWVADDNREQVRQFLGGPLGHEADSFHAARPEGHPVGFSPYDVLAPDGARYAACPSMTVEQCQAIALRVFPRRIAFAGRWLAHHDNRLTYERAMLAAEGGTATDRKGPEKGGAVKCWASHRGAWSYVSKVNKVTVSVLDNWGNGGKNFLRNIAFDKVSAVMTAAEVQAARDSGNLVETEDKTGFYLKADPTKATTAQPPAPPEAETAPVPESSTPTTDGTPAKPAACAADFAALKDTLRAGVKVVAAPNLFPTPAAVAERAVELADLFAGCKLLEPSAGTGNLIEAAVGAGVFRSDVTACEINPTLAAGLKDKAGRVVPGDFFERNGDLGTFDRVLMNPPFDHGSDIQHVRHALKFLDEGGRLVAIVAAGPRQREAFAEYEWHDLPEDAFASQGTGVRTAIVVIDK